MDVFKQYGHTANLPELYDKVIREMLTELPDGCSARLVEDTSVETAIENKTNYVWQVHGNIHRHEGVLCTIPRITPDGYFIVDGIEKFPMINEIFMKSIYFLSDNMCTIRFIGVRKQVKCIFHDTQIFFIFDDMKLPVFNLVSGLGFTFVDVTQFMADMNLSREIVSTAKSIMLIGASNVDEPIPDRHDYFGTMTDAEVVCTLIYMTSLVIGQSIGFYRSTDLSDYQNKTFRCHYDIVKDVFTRTARLSLSRRQTEPKKIFLSLKKDLQHNMHHQIFQRFKTGVSEIFGRRYESVVMTVSRRSTLDLMSSVRKIMIPTDENTRNLDMRMIHPSHRGYICPAETPEGRRVGLIRSLALSCVVSDHHTDIAQIVQSWHDASCEHVQCYFINSICRFVRCPDLLERLIELKRTRRPFMSMHVSFDVVFIRTTRGRPMRLTRDGWFVDPSENWQRFHSVHPSDMLGLSASMIPLSQHNQCARTVFASSMLKQAMELSTGSNMHVDHKRLLYAQRPLVTTQSTDFFSIANGINMVVAICPYLGWNEEDAIVIKKSLVERMGYVYTYVKNVTVVLQVDDIPLTLSSSRDDRYDHGVARKGVTLQPGDPFITYARRSIGNNFEVMSIEHPDDEPVVVVDRVHFDNDKEMGIRFVTERYRRLKIGDKLASRHAQKGVIGHLASEEDLPFAEDGTTPDIVINPHAIPSRMTVGQLIESTLGKQCRFVDGTTFERVDRGGTSDTELLYHPFTGEIIDNVVMGLVYYLVLPHQAADKIHHRYYGEVNSLSNQPLSGRSRGGGLRIGEMEIDCLISHGASELVRTVVRESDMSDVFLCKSCGYFLSYNNECLVCHERCTVEKMPYSMKTIANVLQMANIKVSMDKSV